jgi:hypothetical protein
VIGSAGGSEHMEERRSAIALVLKKARGVVRKEEERNMGGHLGLTVRIPAGFCAIASSVASVISSRGGKDEVDDCRSSVGRVGCVMASENEEEETGDSGLVTSFSGYTDGCDGVNVFDTLCALLSLHGLPFSELDNSRLSGVDDWWPP